MSPRGAGRGRRSAGSCAPAGLVHYSPPELVDVDGFRDLQVAMARASVAVPFEAIWPTWLDRAVACFAAPDQLRVRAVFESDVAGWRAAYAAGSGD